jgi:hypothetical protein
LSGVLNSLTRFAVAAFARPCSAMAVSSALATPDEIETVRYITIPLLRTRSTGTLILSHNYTPPAKNQRLRALRAAADDWRCANWMLILPTSPPASIRSVLFCALLLVAAR